MKKLIDQIRINGIIVFLLIVCIAMKIVASFSYRLTQCERALVIPLLFFFCVFPLSAQWYPNVDGYLQSNVHYDTMTVIPEYHSDMPLDCFIGYLVMDSLARTKQVEEIDEYFARTSLDTLKYIARFLYAACDYNPLLLQKHIWTFDYRQYPDGLYNVYPTFPYIAGRGAVKKRNIHSPFSLLVACDYVLRVKVIDVRLEPEKLGRPDSSYVNVACEVLEVFKGQVFPDNCYFPQAAKEKKAQTLPSCFKFGYPNGFPTDFYPSDVIHPKGFMRPMNKDQEYFVFLGLGMIWSLQGNILPYNNFELNGGVFPIANGRVGDPSNFLGKGTNPTVEEFRTALLGEIQKIKTCPSPKK